MMIKLIKFGPNFGMPDPSPFVVKLETYLRLCDIEYESVNGDVRKAPKGKLPAIMLDGETIGDSEFAIARLKQKFGDPLGEGVSVSQRAEAHVLRLALENHSYFLALSDRWLEDDNAAIVRGAFFSKMGLLSRLIFKMVQRDIRRTTYGLGVLRHSREERDQLISGDMAALETLLGDKPYFGGERPAEIDAATFGFIAAMIVPEFDSLFRVVSRKSVPLVAYHNRMTERVFPDYKETMLVETT